MTDAELRQALVERGPGWIRKQAEKYGAGAIPFPPAVADGFRPFFGGDVDRASVIQALIENPPFYPELVARGADRADLLDFAAGMDGITFETVIVIGPHVNVAATQFALLLFHELVHAVQYRLLGVEGFAERYIDGWLAGRALRGNPMQRYVTIPLELMAYELQARYTAAPFDVFEVESIVRERLAR